MPCREARFECLWTFVWSFPDAQRIINVQDLAQRATMRAISLEDKKIRCNLEGNINLLCKTLHKTISQRTFSSV